jgi:hypothetical protein
MSKVWQARCSSSVASETVPRAEESYRNYTDEKFVENTQTAGRNYAAVTDLPGQA